MPNLRSMHSGRWNCRRKPELLERSGVRRPGREWGLGPGWGTLPVKSANNGGARWSAPARCSTTLIGERETRQRPSLSRLCFVSELEVSSGDREVNAGLWPSSSRLRSRVQLHGTDRNPSNPESLPRGVLRSGHGVESRCRAVLRPLVGGLSGRVLEIRHAVSYGRGLHRHALRIG